jgi:hypothetical protein
MRGMRMRRIMTATARLPTVVSGLSDFDTSDDDEEEVGDHIME